MNYDRFMGMMWGMVAGIGIVAAIEINPLIAVFPLLAVYFNYKFSVNV